MGSGVCVTFFFGALLEYALVNYASRCVGNTGIYRQSETKKAEKSQFGAFCAHIWRGGGGSHSGRDVAPVPKDRVPHLSSIPGGGAQTGKRQAVGRG